MSPQALAAKVRSGEPLQGEDFSAMPLDGLDLSGGLFSECRFTRASMTGVQLADAVFERCVFDGAAMGGAQLTPQQVKEVAAYVWSISHR